MIIKIEKENLLSNLQKVIGVISNKNTLPILSNVLIQTKQGSLELVATDLDVGITTKTNVECIEDGAITLPAKKFTDIIKELPDSLITITARKNNTVSIECKNTLFKIMGIPKEEFPKLPSLTSKNKIKLQQKTLKEMIARTLFAVSHDETRYVLNGILFIIKENEIKMVATDGRRLAVVKKEVDFNKDIKIKSIIPAKTLQELQKNTTEDGDMEISFDENQALFSLNNTTIISRLIEGEFPNYEQAIPKIQKNKLRVDKNEFLTALKRASLLTTPDSQSIKIDVLKDRTIVSKHSPNMGEAREELSSKYAGGEFFIGFNPWYLIEGLKNTKEQHLDIEFSGPEKPAVVRDGNEYLYVVLPMQIT